MKLLPSRLLSLHNLMYALKLRDLRAKCKTILLMSRKVYSREKVCNFFFVMIMVNRTTMIVLFLLVAIKVVGHKKNAIRFATMEQLPTFYPHRTFKHLITSLVTPFPFFHRQSLKITILRSHPSHFFIIFLFTFMLTRILFSNILPYTNAICFLPFLFVL